MADSVGRHPSLRLLWKRSVLGRCFSTRAHAAGNVRGRTRMAQQITGVLRVSRWVCKVGVTGGGRIRELPDKCKEERRENRRLQSKRRELKSEIWRSIQGIGKSSGSSGEMSLLIRRFRNFLSPCVMVLGVDVDTMEDGVVGDDTVIWYSLMWSAVRRGISMCAYSCVCMCMHIHVCMVYSCACMCMHVCMC